MESMKIALDREVIMKALNALQSAPVKFRIDFDPYWLWYDGECVPAIKMMQEALADEARMGGNADAQRRDVGSTVGSMVGSIDRGIVTGQGNASQGTSSEHDASAKERNPRDQQPAKARVEMPTQF